MKNTIKIFIGVLFLFLTASSQAQNMLGYSIKDVRENLDREGLIITSGYTKTDSIFYIIGEDSNVFRVYYFDSTNKCITYLAFIDASEEYLAKVLLDKGYYKVGDYFYKDDHKVIILYDSDVKLNYTQFTYK